jgi:hypothetical protein
MGKLFMELTCVVFIGRIRFLQIAQIMFFSWALVLIMLVGMEIIVIMGSLSVQFAHDLE